MISCDYFLTAAFFVRCCCARPVFGAKQFHPKLQSDMVESYYVSFYGVMSVFPCPVPTILWTSYLSRHC